MAPRATRQDFGHLVGLTAGDVVTVTYQYQGFGTIYDFPFYELDTRTRKVTQSIGREAPRQVAFEGRVTPSERRQVLQDLGGDEIAERLTSLGRAGELSGANAHLICDGGTAILTVTFKDKTRLKTEVHDGGPALTEDQDKALHALHQLTKRYGLDSAELHDKFPW